MNVVWNLGLALIFQPEVLKVDPKAFLVYQSLIALLLAFSKFGIKSLTLDAYTSSECQ
ncbi:MAG: hypothetical protein RMX68_029935 [Aulosira sp. ZfuVER01]|nr:hypothetical protein [Aulosira sp. ZfuVER01]MDZ7997790.1 hypothetical protein [Aulosira sp. DedVER01a]MDZ8052285.1 hypothetical protein [Aulosira sp. ZfuCHP01]